MTSSAWIHALVSVIIAGCLPTVRAEQVSVSVTDSVSSQAVAAVTVLLSRADGTVVEAETDSEGRADFPDLQGGTYWIRTGKPGYVDLLDPLSRGRLAAISPASKTLLSIGLTPTASISGQVLDSQGNPVQGANVRAIVRRAIRKEPRLTPFGDVLGHTDDRGRYRLHGLPPGHYSVAVIPTRGASGFPPTFFSGSVDPGRAVFFELKPGETRTSVVLTIAVQEARSISGKVTGIPAEAGPSRAAVVLLARGGVQVPVSGALTGANGAYVLSDVPPGEYQLMAWTPFAGWDTSGHPAEPGARSASRLVSVSGADLQADLELQPLPVVNGRLLWDGSSSTEYPCSGGNQILFHSEEGWNIVWTPAVDVEGDRFTVGSLPAGRYRVEMPGLGNSCRLAGVRASGEADPSGSVPIDGATPLLLTLTTATGEISGVVSTLEGKAAAGIVVLSPTDGDGSPQVVQLGAEGRYRFSRVLAGEYQLTAMRSMDSTDYLDPVETRALGAERVMVEAERQVTSNLRLVQE